MIKSEVGHLAWILGAFRQLQSIAEKTSHLPLDANFKTTVLNHYASAKDALPIYGLPTTLDRLELAQRYLSGIQNYPTAKIGVDCEEISNCAESELKRCYFGYVAPEKARELLDADTLWAKTWVAFKSTEHDAREAAHCYAFGRNDACVFHAMMVLECGLESLATKLQVKYDARAWGRIIDDIEEEIGKRQKALKVKKPSDFLTFLSVAAKEFTYFKDAWRNHTAHGRAKYDENDARKVLTHVRDFVEHLSERLKEKKR